jgi:hypothetical protein
LYVIEILLKHNQNVRNASERYAHSSSATPSVLPPRASQFSLSISSSHSPSYDLTWHPMLLARAPMQARRAQQALPVPSRHPQNQTYPSSPAQTRTLSRQSSEHYRPYLTEPSPPLYEGHSWSGLFGWQYPRVTTGCYWASHSWRLSVPYQNHKVRVASRWGQLTPSNQSLIWLRLV